MKRLSVWRMAMSMLPLLAIIMSSCEKETVAEGIEIAQSAPKANFKKQVSLNRTDGRTILLEVGATDQALLDRIEPSFFSVDLNAPEPNEGAEGHECAQAHSGEESLGNNKMDPTNALPNRFITVQVLGAYAEEEIHTYAIYFSEAMQDLMRREKLGLQVILSGAENEYTAKTGPGGWKLTRACVRLRLNGDGGVHKTRARTYRANWNGSAWVRGSALHNYLEFLNYTYCQTCHHSGVSRIKDVFVLQDVLSSVWVYDACM